MILGKNEPLSPDIEALLRVERRPIAQSELLRARAFARVRKAMVDPSLAVSTGFGFAFPRFVWPSTAIVVFGAVAAAAVRMQYHASVPAAVSAPRPVPAAVVPASGGASPIRLPISVSAATTTAVATPAPVSSDGAKSPRVLAKASDATAPSTALTSSVFSSEGYAQELAVLQPARSAIARGDFAAALQAVSEHSRLFPSGLLGEERDALRVRALSGLHRSEEANRAVAAFRRRYPRSVFLKSIDPQVKVSP
ncbi:MAG TPA: hypothetical protein VIK01_25640 [Polyangiaceae bacterium]